ncbi:hypothetical protein SAMD00019534_075500 [Acytostelium subglobosum LB1]|uniref:hypothetical protein n=1 Tax=Acytostelium subglobosum LB1 TaxID=1410327 RepID=UPI000644F5A7|nr:hypothetical protein SAMD00019534_075500 [Acytostelium subglobosum LB1]GAM24375.1 hypothetical protein SAMD00019534_075500 [Acytostelium subglobosum LB1]|eukprot:XP_012752701.1 hypothetical protein SAMD00019534_075500 [Acytostelium subglobosum LB1]
MYGLSQDVNSRGTGLDNSSQSATSQTDFNYFDFADSNTQDDYTLSAPFEHNNNNNNNNNSLGVASNGFPSPNDPSQRVVKHSAPRNNNNNNRNQSGNNIGAGRTQQQQIQHDEQHHHHHHSHNHNHNHTHSPTNSGRNDFESQDFMSSQNDALLLDNSQLNFEDPEDMDSIKINLPDYACGYCGLHDPSTVVRCSCGKWFCNGKGKTNSSHIVTHLVKTRHNEISLHADSQFGETVLECYNCGCKNIFLLGFITAKKEQFVVLLCRDPCAMGGSKETTNWDLSNWQPLINSERSFLSWLVKVPSDEDQQRVRQITTKQILKLEEDWKTNPNAVVVEKHGGGPEMMADESAPLPTLLRYEDAYQYQEIITPLIRLESEHEKVLREALSQDNVQLRWEQGLSKKWTAFFSFSRSDFEFKVMPGDELKLQYKGDRESPDWESVGRVTKINDEGEASFEVSLEIYNSHNAPVKASGRFKIDMVWRSTSFDRMQAALKAFAVSKDSISDHLYHALLGHDRVMPKTNVPLPKTYAIKNLPALNKSQIAAAQQVLKSPLSLIQGPPGTGKTVVSSFLVHHFVTQVIKKNEKVLVCAPSNVAIDQLAGKLHSIGLKVVRLCSKLREEVASPVQHLTLHQQVWQLDHKHKNNLKKFKELKDDQGELSAKDEKMYWSLKRAAEITILKEADVICTTCVGAGDPRLASFKFPYVLIDESTQASEPECLIPMMLGARQVVLVGDHCQLGPVLMAKKVIEAGLSKSLFERMINLGFIPFRLTTQYRMHPSLSEFPSSTFYEGQLVNELSYKDRVYNEIKFPWPSSHDPMFFYNCTGPEEISSSGTSFINRTEASLIEKIVTKFLELGTKPQQIGIITPYEGQRSYLVNVMIKTGKLNIEFYKDIEVASVDSFQGREKDFIILSCVRSNEYQGIGFLQDPRRLNVALTRARYGLIICGNAKVLSRDQLWNNLICHIKEKNLLVDGTLSNLKPSSVQLQKPRKLYGEGKLPVAGAQPTGFSYPDQRGPVDPALASSMVYGQRPPKYYDNNNNNNRYSPQTYRGFSGLGGNPYTMSRITNSMATVDLSQRMDGSQSVNGFSQQSASQESSQSGGYFMSQSFPMSLNEMSQESGNINLRSKENIF